MCRLRTELCRGIDIAVQESRCGPLRTRVLKRAVFPVLVQLTDELAAAVAYLVGLHSCRRPGGGEGLGGGGLCQRGRRFHDT